MRDKGSLERRDKIMFWVTSYASLFKVDCGVPVYMPSIGVHHIQWDGVINKVCIYCGYTMKNGICHGGCEKAKGVFLSDAATVTLSGRFPEATEYILDFQQGDELAVVLQSQGTRRDEYTEKNGGMKFFVRKIVRRNIPIAVAVGPSEDDLMFLRTTIECTVKLILPEE